MTRNRELLLKTAQRIEEVPESYDQSSWGHRSKEAPCGTQACLAGEIVICSEPTVKDGIKKLFDILDGHLIRGYVDDVAAELAGLTSDEADALFYSAWPADFYPRFAAARTAKGRAKVAAELLRYVADGGEICE